MSLEQEIKQLSACRIEELIEESEHSDQPRSGYQGSIHVIVLAGQKLLVKSVARTEQLRWLRRHTLGNEYRVYQQLTDVPGVPKCYGLIDKRYLLLEHINGVAFRELEFAIDDELHPRLLQLIENLHNNGVAHADLKRRDNLILGENGEPYMVDFGTAIIRKPGFSPINHMLFGIARQLDYHGWYKNKYRKSTEPHDPADAKYYRPLRTERAARWVRRIFRRPLAALRQRLALR